MEIVINQIVNTHMYETIVSREPANGKVLLKFDFYSDVTDTANAKIYMSPKILEQGYEEIELNAESIVKEYFKPKTFIPHCLTLIDATPEFKKYEEVLFECFQGFSLTFMEKVKKENFSVNLTKKDLEEKVKETLIVEVTENNENHNTKTE